MCDIYKKYLDIFVIFDNNNKSEFYSLLIIMGTMFNENSSYTFSLKCKHLGKKQLAKKPEKIVLIIELTNRASFGKLAIS